VLAKLMNAYGLLCSSLRRKGGNPGGMGWNEGDVHGPSMSPSARDQSEWLRIRGLRACRGGLHCVAISAPLAA
jgi:hypothetical protein